MGPLAGCEFYGGPWLQPSKPPFNLPLTDSKTYDDNNSPELGANAIRLVQVRQSPYIDTFYKFHHARVTIDSGATCNMIRLSAVRRFGAEAQCSSQSANQADGSSPLNVVGETRLTFHSDSHAFQFEGLVVENLDVDILADTPFMSTNDVAIRSAKRQDTIGDNTTLT